MRGGSLPLRRGSGAGRLERYSRRAEPAMLVLALASAPLFLLEHRHWLAAMAGWLVVAAFFADLVIRVLLVEGPRRGYLLHHWYDVAIVVLSLLPVLAVMRGFCVVRSSGGCSRVVGVSGASGGSGSPFPSTASAWQSPLGLGRR